MGNLKKMPKYRVVASFEIHGKEITERVREDLDDPKKAFIHYPLLECYRCDLCKYKKECNYQEVRNLYLAVKKKMSTAHINQEKIGDFFSNLLHKANAKNIVD